MTSHARPVDSHASYDLDQMIDGVPPHLRIAFAVIKYVAVMLVHGMCESLESKMYYLGMLIGHVFIFH
jgi:hypothetical protein